MTTPAEPLAPAGLTVTVSDRAARRARRAHPWIFRSDVSDAGAARSGELCRVRTERGRSLGYAFYSERSAIALRRASESDEPPSAGLWHERVTRALVRRRGVVPQAGASRLIFGESDGLPGLVVDRYAEHLVVQCLTAGAERLLEPVLGAIAAELSVASVLARNDPAVRELEGLPREVQQIRGRTPETIEIDEGGLRIGVDVWRGQKTGLFLDQRVNRLDLASPARGRVLDVFCYQASFGLLAARSADEVLAIDGSAVALARAAADAAANGIGNLRLVEGNAFDELRQLERGGERFDLVALDPPAFAKSRRDLDAAARAYKEINLRAMRLLAPRGRLVTSSCSYHLAEETLVEILAEAAADVGRGFQIVERRSQAPDHPIRLGFPESRYLKCLVLEAE